MQDTKHSFLLHRTFQYVVLIVVLTTIAGGIYHYFNVRAAKINTTSTTFNTNGLVGYWTFDGADTPWTSSTAATTLDKSGNNNTGTLTNMSQSTSPVIGKVGQALYFDRVDDYINLGSPLLSENGNFTISAWVSLTDFNDYNAIISQYASGQTGRFLFETSGTSLVVFDGAGTWGSGFTLSANIWTHVVLVRSNNTYIMYKDGIGSTPVSSSVALYQGISTQISGSAYRTKGKIDDVRIYNRALSVAEITDLYTMGTATVNASTNSLNTNGLVGQWSFDGKQTVWTSSSAATTLDTSGNNYTGTLTNMSQSTSPVIGKIGQALNFDGSNDYVDLGAPVNMNFERTNPYSLVAWVKKSARSSYGAIIARMDNTASYRGYDMFYCGTSSSECTPGSVKAHIINSWSSNAIAVYVSSGGTIIDDNNWHNVIVTYDGSSSATGIKIYIDGTVQTTTNPGYTLSATVVPAVNWKIATRQSESIFGGSIDDVRIYNRALSAAEVTDLYNQGTVTANASTNALNANGLVGQWSFDGKQTVWTSSSAATTLDTSGNNNTGTLTSMSQSTSPVIGKIGQGLYFDGSNDYVSVADANSLDLANNFTISVWFKPAVLTQTNRYLLSKLKTGTDVDNAYSIIWEYVDNTIEFYSGDYTGTAPRTGSGISISDTSWHHVVYSYDGTTWAGYKDGTNVFSVARTFSLNSSNKPLILGNLNAVGGNFFANGSIDDVRIYNRALSADEIASLYNQGR